MLHSAQMLWYNPLMRIKDWGFVNEREFVREAMSNPIKRSDFKRFNVQLVERIVQEYIQLNNLSNSVFHDLVETGMSVFDNAFNKYIRLPNAFESATFLFSTYYTYWVRRAIKARLANKR
jgi:hypothetical protein